MEQAQCAICGSRLVPEEHRKMFCTTCKGSVDRDVNAAQNILLRGTRVVPDGTAGEAVMAELGRKEPEAVESMQPNQVLGFASR
ncbi:MAG: transposase [Thaumarchaeota archaeon]|nr:transposase [Nitrososphaerota archaeon]